MIDVGSVTVVIPNWNRADLLATILKQLAIQTYPIARTIVVDNGSTDSSVSVAQAHGASVICHTINYGFAYAVNRGIEASETDWVAILNNDVELEPDWLESLVGSAAATGSWFAVGKLLTPDRSRIDGTFDLISAGGAAWRCGSGRLDGPLWSEASTIQFAPMTAAVFRREVFQRLGLLDERFESYLEDVDLGFRCAAAGLKGVYVPSAAGTHAGSATRGAWHKATVRQISRNQMFLFFKHFRGSPRWKILVGQLLWGLLAFRHGTAGAWLSGKWEGCRRRSELSDKAHKWSEIREAVERSEQELYRFQQSGGFDFYWRWYFRMTGGGARWAG